MKDITKRLNKLCPKSILTLLQRKRLVDALGESLADIAEKNLTNSKIFLEDNQCGRNRKISGYITAEEREEVARILDAPSVAERMQNSLETAVITGNPFPHAMDALTMDELTHLIEAIDT